MATEPSTDDELLSAYLDDEATLEEIARIEIEPDLQQRLVVLRAAKELVAVPVAPLEAGDADLLVGNALATGDPPAGTADLTKARARRQSRNRIALGVAAGVLLVAVAVPLLRAINTGGSIETAEISTGDAPTSDDAADDTAADETGIDLELQATEIERPSSVEDAGDDVGPADEGAPNGDGALDADFLRGRILADIGAVEDVDALEAAVSVRLEFADSTGRTADPAPSTTAQQEATVPCFDQMGAFTSNAALVVVDSAVIEVGGVLTAVALVESPASTVTVLIADLDTCAPITELTDAIP